MTLKQSLRNPYAPLVQALRKSRRGKSRPVSRHRFLLGTELLEDRLAPAILTVNSLADNTTDTNDLTLREAIFASEGRYTPTGVQLNQISGALGSHNDTIQFAPSIDGETISLSSTVSTNAGPSAFAIPDGETLVIDGETGLTQGITIERDSTAGAFRLFYVDTTANLTLKGLTLTGGLAQGGNGGSTAGNAGGGGGAAGLGGAIFDLGNLTILDSTLTGNTAQGGNGGNASATVPSPQDSSGGGGGGGMGGPGGDGGVGLTKAGIVNLDGGAGGPPSGGPTNQYTSVFTYPTGTGGGIGGGGSGGLAHRIGSIPNAGPGYGGGFGGGGGGGGEVYAKPLPPPLPPGNGTGAFGSTGGGGGFGGGGGGAAGSQGNFVSYNGGSSVFGGGKGGDGNNGNESAGEDDPGPNGGGSGGGGGAGMGGAVFTQGGTVVITNSTFTGNSAIGGSAGKGAIQNLPGGGPSTAPTAGAGYGGGLFNLNGTVTVTNSTCSGNTATTDGSSMYMLGFGNGGKVTTNINNTIMSDNSNSDLVVRAFTGDGALATVSGHANLIGSDRLEFINGSLGTSSANPELGPLSSLNGGLTPTMAIPSDSPAIGAGVNSGVGFTVPLTDQRGVLRGATIDIGAYQARLFANMIVNTTSGAENLIADTLSLPEAIALTNGTLHLTDLPDLAPGLVTAVPGVMDTITFDSSLTQNAAATISLSNVGDSSVGSSAFLINDQVVIDGPTGDYGITLSAAAASMRLFVVGSTGSLTLQDLTLSGGTSMGAGVGWGQGGAIYNEGALTILDSTLTGNTAHGGGSGGSGNGGAVYNQAGTVGITNDTFYNNSAIGGTGPGQGLGGGLFNHNGTVTVSNSTFSKNNVTQGNGSTLIAAGRNIYNLGDFSTATLSIISTIVGQADTNSDPDATVQDVTATSSNGGISQVLDHSGNLIRLYSGFPASVITADPLLGPLQNNGGPTETMALPADSPAAGQGVWNAGAASTDQRGVTRPVLNPDIGAYQHTNLHIVVNTTADIANPAANPNVISLREAIAIIEGTLSPTAPTLSATQLALISDTGNAPNTITFDSSLVSSPGGATINLSIVGDTSVGQSAFLIDSQITIDGPSGDSGITLAASGALMRLFNVTAIGNLTLQDLTLSGGDIVGTASSSGTGGAALGGAIYSQGTLTILDDTFTDDEAQGGKGGANSNGGAGKGGAIFNQGGTLSITNSTFNGNQAVGGSAGTGTGTAAGPGLGGALYNAAGQLAVDFSTISGNTAAGGGRDIYTTGGGATLYYSIIAQSDTNVTDLVVTGGGILNGGFNLINQKSVPGSAFSSTITGNPLLGSLSSLNGGPTATMALAANSPAIGVVPGGSLRLVTTDQRGVYRNLPADLGAYQLSTTYNMVVNTANDDTNTTDGMLSLREAIEIADGTLKLSALTNLKSGLVTPATGNGNTITFDPRLDGKTITLSIVGDTSFGPSALSVDSLITIDGPNSSGSGITLSAAGTTMRLFDVTSTGNLTLENLTLSGGTAQGFAGGNADLGGAGGGGAGLGGAIFNQGALTIQSSTLTGNTAQGGAGGSAQSLQGGGGAGGAGLSYAGGNPPQNSVPPNMVNYGGNGGGADSGVSVGGFGGLSFYPNGEGGTSGVGGGGGFGNNSSLSGSGGSGGFGAGGGGGGEGGSSFGTGGNGGFGGGAGADAANATGGQINGGYGGGDSGVAGDQLGAGGGAGMGGAVFNYEGTVIITNSTFAGNAARGGAGGDGIDAIRGGAGEGLGGGVFNYDGALTVNDSTISLNTAANGGRGIVIFADGTNATATAQIDNSIIGQSDTSVSDLVVNQINKGSATVSGGTNLIGTPINLLNGATDLNLTGTVTANPQLGSLQPNGGPAPTMAPNSGSPAVAAGIAVSGVTTDERGVSRGSVVDIGAFQVNRLVVESNSGAVSTTPASLTLPGAISLADQYAGTMITFDPAVFGTAQTITLQGTELELSNTSLATTITGPNAGVTISGNQASGVFQVDGGVTASISGLTITGGSVSGNGGGLVNLGTIMLTDCTISSNSAAGDGGGLFNSGTATLTLCTIAENSAGSDGGGLFSSGTATLTFCTIAANSAASGGGLFDLATATNSGAAMLTDTIVAGNTTGGASDIGGTGSLTGTFNLIGTGNAGGLTSANHNQLGVTSPELGTLGNYGGQTPTIPLLPGSPALGAGTKTLYPGTGKGINTDQRGLSLDATPDIGAFQTHGFILTVASNSTKQQADINTAFANPLSVTVRANRSGDPVAGGVITFSAPTNGASAVFSSSTATIGSNGVASVIATANGTTGGYNITASAIGALGPVTFGLTNVLPFSITSIAAVSPNPTNAPVSSIDVTFSRAMAKGALALAAVTLTDNGNPVAVSGLSLAGVSGNTYAISGLAGLTTAQGLYSLTVNAADFRDQSGLAGTGTISTSWLMDTTPPTSTVGSLPAQTIATSFSVPVSATDPVAADGGSPSGLASIAVFESVNGGPFTLLGTITPSGDPASDTGSVAFSGQAGDTYVFYSVATDATGNVQLTVGSAQQTVQIVSPVSVSSIAAVSPNPRNSAVSSIDVTFSEPINTSSLASGALTLTDNGGANLINSGVTIAPVSGDTYAIGGLSSLTTAQGQYTFAVNAADIQDPYGFFGTGTASTKWSMDTTPPTSTVSPLPARETSLSFPVSVTGSDGGNPAAGVASYAIDVSINGGSWLLWKTVPASNPTATYTGKSDTTYAFYSIATDNAGNTEVKSPTIEASTYVPDLTPPVTTVDATSGSNPSTIRASSGTFTLNITGNDSGGSPITDFEVFASVGGGPYTMVNGAAIPAGPADSQGNVHASILYQGLTDGQAHTYAFYSIGFDGAGNVQQPPAAPNLTLTETFANATASQLQVTGLVVENSAVERSYIRYLDVDFNESNSQSGGELTQIADSIGSGSPEILLYKYDLNGDASSKTAVSLSGVSVTVIDHAIELDFGPGGLGGSPNTTTADGYYEIDIKLPNNTTAVHHFYRLLGDVDGDGVVDSNDLNEIAAEINLSSPTGMMPLAADVNGDGTVSAMDLTLATRSKGRKLGSGLSLG